MYELRPYTHHNHPCRPNPNRTVFDPFRDLEELEKRFFGRPFDFPRLPDFKTDIRETDGGYTLEADLPGCEKKDIHLELNGELLTIRAERHSQAEEGKDGYLRCERSYGSYRRDFDVSAIDVENITAKYDNGVLQVTLPKKEKALPETRELEIQ